MMMNHDDDDLGAVVVGNVNLDDIIKERKGQQKMQAEERRQVDLQRIVDMKSKTGIDPLQRFPKEIWNKVFDELDPDDRANIWHVHPIFRDIMESRRIRDILLPQVLKVEIFERYVKYRDGNVILRDFNYYERLRGVSKAIRNSFDRHTEEKLIQRIRELEAPSHSSQYQYGGAVIVSLSLSSTTERLVLRRLLASFQDDQQNPGKRYFPRDLRISFTDLDIENENREDVGELLNNFKRDLTSLLGLIGCQILHLRFEFCNPETSNVEFSPMRLYIIFQQLISLMPNLRWLEVEAHMTNDFPEEEEEVHAILRRHPFPRLVSLERLTCHWPVSMGGNQEVFNIYWTIMETNPHLKMLDLDELDGDGLEGLPDHLIKALPLTSFRPCAAGVFEPVTLENIEEIVNFNWPLQTINLSLDYSETKSKSSMIPLLTFLEKFPTLETVKLKELKGFKFGKEDAFEYLMLPNLKNLEVVLSDPEIRLEGNIHFFFSLQFLLHCGKLETLKWNMRLDKEDTELRKYLKKHENGKTVDFRAGMTVVYESNIWDVFPSLDNIKVEVIKDWMNTCCRRSPLACEHEYRRSERRGMSYFRKFLKNHGCSSRNSLQNCVVLKE